MPVQIRGEKIFSGLASGKMHLATDSFAIICIFIRPHLQQTWYMGHFSRLYAAAVQIWKLDSEESRQEEQIIHLECGVEGELCQHHEPPERQIGGVLA